jgi:N6-L-threonylcarbamoyladenine synthase
MAGEGVNKADVAASFQKAVADVLVDKSIKACLEAGSRTFALAGGVACNLYLRGKLERACAEKGISFRVPKPVYCADNAAMVAACAGNYYHKGLFSPLSLNAIPTMTLCATGFELN